MMIIGCDFHPSWPTSLLGGSGDGGDGRAEVGACDGRLPAVLSATAGAGVDRNGSDGEQSVVHRTGAGLGHEIWIGDAAQIRASYVRKQKTDKRMRRTF